MGEYTRYDFSESLDRVTLPSPVEHVIAAWGRSPEGYGSWEGGFLLRLIDGKVAYLTGWCDTTGWGCQDGASIELYDSPPPLESLSGSAGYYLGDTVVEKLPWDVDPSDLNRWVKAGMPRDGIHL